MERRGQSDLVRCFEIVDLENSVLPSSTMEKQNLSRASSTKTMLKQKKGEVREHGRSTCER